jgi:hypothetical protein
MCANQSKVLSHRLELDRVDAQQVHSVIRFYVFGFMRPRLTPVTRGTQFSTGTAARVLPFLGSCIRNYNLICMEKGGANAQPHWYKLHRVPTRPLTHSI